MNKDSEINWQDLFNRAWAVRENANIKGTTKVGSCLITNKGNYYVGCNVEQTFRNHDVHAEVNAITNMITNGEHEFYAIAIVAERNQFTPCGSCLDWIFQFGGEDCIIGVQNKVGSDIKHYSSKQLMPHYPH